MFLGLARIRCRSVASVLGAAAAAAFLRLGAAVAVAEEEEEEETGAGSSVGCSRRTWLAYRVKTPFMNR